MSKIVEILPDLDSLIARSLSIVRNRILEAISDRNRCTIALAGGSTPKPLYRALAQEHLPWDKIHIFWGDERYVPPNHPDSNQKMAREAWLDQVNFPNANIHAIPTDANNPQLDADKYEAELLKFFGQDTGDLPTFDIVLLGMGDDGHTASLFPHTEALTVSDRLITVGNKDGQPRLTFTVPLINQARCVIFLVAGTNKQTALTQIFAPDGDAMAYPSRLIQPIGELWWFLDQTAGAVLN